jgi:hypothetical protein
MAKMEDILKAIREATDTDKQAFVSELEKSGYSVRQSLRSDSEDQKELEYLKKRAQLQGEVAAATKNAYEEEKARIKVLADSLVDDEKKADVLRDIDGLYESIKTKQGRQDAALFKFDIPELDKAFQKMLDMSETQELINAGSKEFANQSERAAKGMADFVGIKTTFAETRIGKVTDLFAQMSGDTEEARGNAMRFGQELATAFSPQNIGASVFTKIFDESMKTLRAYDNAVADLSKTTGTVDKFNNVLYDAQRAGNLLGVSMADVGTAIAALNAGTSNFAKLNESTQTQLAISTSQFEKLGVSAQDTADFMENAFKIMNMGATEAVETQTELAMAGVQLGIGADKIVKDFNAASKTLAVYGKGSVKIFKDLAAQAKAAGVEVSTLLGIAQKFDTFSGAAEGAAQFNALLGTQLSTTQMLMMTEEDRMKTLVESVQAQGVAFGDMDRFTQKSIAAAAGITDMNEANRIFSMSLADYEANAREMENNAAAQAKFDEAVQATVPTMNKFKNLATEMITLVQPALETLGEVADYLTDFFQGLSKEAKETVSMIALFVSGVMVLAPLFAVGGGFMAGLAAVGPAIAGIGTGIATALGAISAATVATGGLAAGIMVSLLAGGAIIGTVMSSMAESEAKAAEANAKMMSQGSDTIQAMKDISTADFSGIATKFKGVVDELNSMGTDVKVTSMLQNLSLISAGTAIDITGAKIAGSSTNISTTVKNMFEGATINLKAGGREFEGYVEELAANVQMSNSKA